MSRCLTEHVQFDLLSLNVCYCLPLAMRVFFVDSPNAFFVVDRLLHEAQIDTNLRWSGNFDMRGCQASKDNEFYVDGNFRKHLEREGMLKTFLDLQSRALPLLPSYLEFRWLWPWDWYHPHLGMTAGLEAKRNCPESHRNHHFAFAVLYGRNIGLLLLRRRKIWILQ